MKQTAVDWAFNQLDEQVYKVDYDTRRISISISFEDMMTIKREAKEMEKEQIIEALCDGHESHPCMAEQYYNETYKQL